MIVNPAAFNQIYYQLQGFLMLVFGDMSERRSVLVVGYRLEPSCMLLGKNKECFVALYETFISITAYISIRV